ncbi:hypothetical protein CDD80_1497 [Ophiocordyceps camponoti-rufipedis]|uniref:Endonuclease/exonuclease/phosphatase domain-containing protein n=1 Tax=Ophiocordyceps camponoti-rufipedis TaxID=2004952 RepID=A0A2C5Z9E1_9HYPO|nr:hypothetical protein CDD80_1497 [Ophiocordyceps camponoti-rufipedis]
MTTSTAPFNIFQWNCKKSFSSHAILLNNQTQRLGFNLEQCEVIALQEVYLNPRDMTITRPYHSLSASHHCVFTSTPKTRIATFIRKDIALKGWHILQNDACLCAIEFFCQSSRFLVINAYQSSSAAHSDSLILQQALQLVKEYTGSGVILIGDLNAHHPLWSPEDLSSNARGIMLAQATEDLALTVLPPRGTVTRPSRQFTNSNRQERGSTIDLVLTRYKLISCRTLAVVDNSSDYLPVVTEVIAPMLLKEVNKAVNLPKLRMMLEKLPQVPVLKDITAIERYVHTALNNIRESKEVLPLSFPSTLLNNTPHMTNLIMTIPIPALTRVDVKKAIDSLVLHKATDSDDIASELLQSAVAGLSTQPADDWLQRLPTTDTKTHCAMALLSTLGKVMEFVLASKLQSLALQYDVLPRWLLRIYKAWNCGEEICRPWQVESRQGRTTAQRSSPESSPPDSNRFKFIRFKPTEVKGHIGVDLSNEIKVLGVLVDSQLHFRKQIRAVRNAGIHEIRNLEAGGKSTMAVRAEIQQAYKEVVLPAFLHGCSAWHSLKSAGSPAAKALNVIQQRANVQISGGWKDSIPFFGWPKTGTAGGSSWIAITTVFTGPLLPLFSDGSGGTLDPTAYVAPAYALRAPCGWYKWK